jgi:hypothetical protein
VKTADGGDDHDDHDDHDDAAGGDSFPSWGAGRTVLSDDGGHFTVTKLRRGTYAVVAEATKGGTRAQKTGVKTGDTITLTLERLGSLTGVVAAGGAPVASYDITCHGPGGSPRRHVSAPDGTYTIDRLAPGKYTCDVTADAGTASGSTTITTAGGKLDLAVVPWASVTGVVVDAQGAPLAGLKVVVTTSRNDNGAAFAELLTGGGPTTDASGRFEVGHLADGDAQLMVFDAGKMQPVVTKSIVLTGGQRLDLGKVSTDPPDAGADAGASTP